MNDFAANSALIIVKNYGDSLTDGKTMDFIGALAK